MKVKLSTIKPKSKYIFTVTHNGGAGSGSWGIGHVTGMVKEINAEFIRVIPTCNLEVGNKRSIKVYNYNITEVEII
jgi:hypothetical protein